MTQKEKLKDWAEAQPYLKQVLRTLSPGVKPQESVFEMVGQLDSILSEAIERKLLPMEPNKESL